MGSLLAVLEGSMDGLIVLDSEDRVVLWNRGASVLLGVEEREAIGRPIEYFIPSSIVHELPAMRSYEHVTRRFEARLPKGGSRSLDLMVTRTDMRDHDGGIGAASLILKDITELKHLQSELAHAEHLAGLGRLSASIAHEIKNPIAGLRGAMEVISQVHKPGDPRFVIFQEALAQIRRLDNLVKDLLAYAKPVNLTTEPIPPSLLIETTLPLVKELLAESGVTYKNGLDESLPPVMVDPQQIRQVFINLMQNAIQAMGPGGIMEISATQSEGELGIHISDAGCGIPPEEIEKIFHPFFTTKHIGTGLGLSIVQRILSAHGGKCVVESTPGKGSKFTVFLPTMKRAK